MPYPLAPLSQSCSPIPHLSGPIPALLYLFSHPSACSSVLAISIPAPPPLFFHPCFPIHYMYALFPSPTSPVLLPYPSSWWPHPCTAVCLFSHPCNPFFASLSMQSVSLPLHLCSSIPAPLSQPPIPAPLSLLPNYLCYPFPSPLYKHLCPCYSIPVSLSAPPSLLLIPVPYPCSGLSKVASCQRKSLPTWLVSTGYSAWHFFTDFFS